MSKKIELPNKLKVRCRTYKTKIVESLGKDWGRTLISDRKMLLQDNLTWRDLKETAVHEIVHTIFHDLGLDSYFRNENLCSGIASVLIDIIEDNPEWMKVLAIKESKLK